MLGLGPCVRVGALTLLTGSKMSKRNKRGKKKTISPIPSPVSTSPSCSSTSTHTSEDDNSSYVSPRKSTRKEGEQRRRIMMNQYFDELITLLSMISERNIPKKMDKATTLMEAVNCMKVYFDLCQHSEAAAKQEHSPKMPTSEKPPGYPMQFRPDWLPQGEVLQFFLDAHDIFMLVTAESGRILYTTELITSLLGHMQTRLVGQNIFDYVLDTDKSYLAEAFEPLDALSGMPLPNSPIIAFPSKTFQCHLKLYSGETSCFPHFLPFTCLSYLRRWSESESRPVSPPLSPGDSEMSFSTTGSNQQSCVLLFGKLPTSLTLIDLPVGTNDVNFEFEMRVSREGIIIDVDKHAVLIFGFELSELIGSSFFDYVDPYHILDVGESMSAFLASGLGTTAPYRFCTKGGRYLWFISKGYLSYNPWNHKPDHILLSNRILGCDQVLPEHRFFRSRKLLPNLEGQDSYEPPPLQSVSISAPVTTAAVKPIDTSARILPVVPKLPPPLVQSTSVRPVTPLTPMDGMPNEAASGNRILEDIQRELERKNQELFELQKKLLEQQQLIEKERSQFYQVTQQVMQCIGNSVTPGIPSNLQMAMQTLPQSQPSTTVPSKSHSIGNLHGLTMPANTSAAVPTSAPAFSPAPVPTPSIPRVPSHMHTRVHLPSLVPSTPHTPTPTHPSWSYPGSFGQFPAESPSILHSIRDVPTPMGGFPFPQPSRTQTPTMSMSFSTPSSQQLPTFYPPVCLPFSIGSSSTMHHTAIASSPHGSLHSVYTHTHPHISQQQTHFANLAQMGQHLHTTTTSELSTLAEDLSLLFASKEPHHS